MHKVYFIPRIINIIQFDTCMYKIDTCVYQIDTCVYLGV